MAAEQIEPNQRIISKGNYFAMVGREGYEGQNVGDNTIQLLTTSGDLLWKKSGLSHIREISIDENSGNLLASYNYDFGDMGRNAYFKSDGTELWNIHVPDPGITIGPGGHYGIISTTGGEDDGGKFRIFDMTSGLQLENNPLNSIDYQYFRAVFVDEFRVAVFYQNIVLKPIRSEQRRTMQLRKEGKLKRPRRVDEIVSNEENPNFVDVTTFPVSYLLYSIASGEVIEHKALVSASGGIYEFPGIRHNNLAVSNDLGSIMLELGNSAISRDASQIVAVNIDGTVLWESAELPEDCIESLSVLESGDILIDAQPASTYLDQGFILLNGRAGSVKWRSDIREASAGDSKFEWIEKALNLDGEILVQTNYGGRTNKLYFLSELDGTQRQIAAPEEYLLSVSPKSGEVVTYSRILKSIILYR
ncbi:hypothetical protein ACFL6E_03775 [Candidatus Neomarinimicrobiota bacterium]